ncbi:NAD(P)-binding protein [Xylona heveae TC161]|uniref:NAD(P)-binding protein n=1 Tax=Xylona heveae (strain CBS 132557 / TC161) TaxID=1328760 RepID=A0A165JZE4_XYLHT|nr:NAD(P)-binding protein [Xylona heveae TC161]KZF26820.1 NAD(P)-binding protein [Xylona heveae TC161]
MVIFGHNTTSEEVAALFADQVKGKIVLITGASPGGLGAQTAIALSRSQPKLLIIAGRDISKLLETEKQIKAASADTAVRPLVLDLSSLKQVRKAAAEVNGYPESIDVLINNAGIMASPFSLTEDGFESQFGVNHLGHFLFTNLIMPKILAAGPGARIVNISSRGHQFEGIRFDDYNFENGRDYNKWKGYGQSKTANILFSLALAEKLKSKGLLAYSVYPGGIATNLARHLTPEDVKALGWWDENGKAVDNDLFKWKTVSQGASTQIVAAFSPDIVDQNGAYLKDCNVDMEAVAPYAKDTALAMKLWTLSEDLVGEKFNF